MGLSVNQEETPVSNRIAAERLYLNADKSAVVLPDDPDARFLLAGEGDEIDPAIDVDIPAKFLVKPAGETKEAAKPADKAVSKAANK